VQIQGASDSSAAWAVLRLLRSTQGAGDDATQSVPGDGQNSPGGAPPASGDGAANMSDDMLATLMAMQTQPPSASDLASQMLANADSDGDGSRSLSEVQTALKSDSSDTGLTAAFSKLDTNGDGKLDSDELTATVSDAQQAAGPPQGGGVGGAHHAHHHHAAASGQDSADQLISDLDTDGDGQLSSSELMGAFSSDNLDASQTNALQQAFATMVAKLDSNSDGLLSQTELAAA
jgi:Ca2+-binding EF-hand superfamily protein